MCVVYDRIPEVGTVSINQRHLNVFFMSMLHVVSRVQEFIRNTMCFRQML